MEIRHFSIINPALFWKLCFFMGYAYAGFSKNMIVIFVPV